MPNQNLTPKGLMWADTREDVGLRDKIEQALKRFHTKYDRQAHEVQVNRDDARKAGWTPAAPGEAVTTVLGVPVVIHEATLASHIVIF